MICTFFIIDKLNRIKRGRINQAQEKLSDHHTLDITRKNAYLDLHHFHTSLYLQLREFCAFKILRADYAPQNS